ncbi:blast:Cytochrome c oxidase subunit 6B1 [Drosophila guanche]|uniref:Cytochrome c oxidase subunit n=1 Tax=Drosophila guanche TaxID=7266 RepID=A0A3B0KMN3_DROGU|nr:blast:Cytochrome c oxidase subunit 6B1 [Drosophila guanche]
MQFFMSKNKNSDKSLDSSNMSAYKLETAPFDPRFPNQNVTRYCYQSYIDFHRCQKKRGEDFAPCNYFQKVYKTMCPNAWVEKWDDQRESGTFPGRI